VPPRSVGVIAVSCARTEIAQGIQGWFLQWLGLLPFDQGNLEPPHCATRWICWRQVSRWWCFRKGQIPAPGTDRSAPFRAWPGCGAGLASRVWWFQGFVLWGLLQPGQTRSGRSRGGPVGFGSCSMSNGQGRISGVKGPQMKAG